MYSSITDFLQAPTDNLCSHSHETCNCFVNSCQTYQPALFMAIIIFLSIIEAKILPKCIPLRTVIVEWT